MATSPSLSRPALARVLESLFTAELKAARGNRFGGLTFRQPLTGLWPDKLQIAGDGPCALGCDSLEAMGLAAAANEMFHLYEAHHEQDLAAAETFGGWLDLIEAAWRSGVDRMTFRTSGSTGLPKRCTHELSSLHTEVRYLATLFAKRHRVHALAQPHHIYGFLFTALLPDVLGLEVLSPETTGIGVFTHDLRAGDLVVAVPDHWQFLDRTIAVWPAGIIGVVSTAPCPPALIQSLIEHGLSGITEVYGSSETAGIGVRVWPEAAYRLMPQWQFGDSTDDGRTELVHTSGSRISMMDRMSFLDIEEGTFLLAGRQDDAVQVGGTNVFPEQITAKIRLLPDVAAAAVRLMRPEEGVRLKAFIVLSPNADEAGVRHKLNQWIEASLIAAERPKSLTFGSALPVSASGKAADW